MLKQALLWHVLVFTWRMVDAADPFLGITVNTTGSTTAVTERGVVSAVDGSRGLAATDTSSCLKPVLWLGAADVLYNWSGCLLNEAKAKDKAWGKRIETVPGATWATNFECWCDKKVRDSVQYYGCCDHSDYKMLCEAQCKPNCSSAAAKQCIKDCPALCLESDYAPDLCAAGCKDCNPYMKCIADRSINQTLAGNPANPHICDDVGLDRSPEWQAFKSCYTKHPKRTHWHRHNAENHCYCEANLKKAAQDHKCCEAKWGKTICDNQCTNATATIDCNSSTAQSCMKECNEKCRKLYTAEMVPECKKTCFAPTSECAKFSVCEPVGPFELPYVCDDGKKPLPNGCCPTETWLFTTMGCPSLCKSGTGHYPTLDAAGYRISHGLECQCNGCPNSTATAKAKWKETLTKDLEKSGDEALSRISREIGILGANRKMQEFMKERNDAIMKAFGTHASGVPDAAWDRRVKDITDKYHELIRIEARAFKARGEKDVVATSSTTSSSKRTNSSGQLQTATGTNSEAASIDEDEDAGVLARAGITTPILVFMVVLCLLVASVSGLLVYVFQLRKKTNASVNANAPGKGTEPLDGDVDVVLGRPVMNPTGAITGGAPVCAVVVTADTKGGKVEK